ncbi:MAG: hypothetical protein WCT03_06105 [Candidatus Obscuribacterales bacterium]|jgi:hypothetical protein
MTTLQKSSYLLFLSTSVAIGTFTGTACYGRTNDWSYPQKATIWHEALGPYNTDANAIVEGRTFSFASRTGKRAREYELAFQTIAKAVQLAEPHITDSRDDVANCYINLACFQYLKGDLNAAEQNMHRALKIATGSPKSLGQVADILDYLAVIQRAQAGATRSTMNTAKYADDAERSYLINRNQRNEKVKDVNHPDIRNVNSHLQMSYFDVGGSEGGGPETTLKNIKTHILTPPIYATTGEDSLSKMVSFAREMINKFTPPPPPPPPLLPPEERLGTIMGNWKVATDIRTTASIKTVQVTKVTVEGTESRVGSGEQASNVAQVPIFLCRASDYAILHSKIVNFGQSRGLSMDKFGVSWPATHKQAEDLLVQLSNCARNLPRVQEQKTDKNGDYEFTDLPKGQYILFAALVTQNSCAYWICPQPNEPITVKQIGQFTIDFSTENQTCIWRKVGNSLRSLGQ